MRWLRNMTLVKLSIAFAAVGLTGCVSSTPGARPQDMSVAGHEAAARAGDMVAAAHLAKYDPDASTSNYRCDTDPLIGPAFCHTTSENPTEGHLALAERHQEMAADHRAAAESLRKAEDDACAGLDAKTGERGPFARPDDVASTEVLPKGALLELRAQKGLDQARLETSVRCHLAQNATLGHEMPGMSHCPLALKDVSAEVIATSGTLAVAVESDDPRVVREIRRRAIGLMNAPGKTQKPPTPGPERH